MTHPTHSAAAIPIAGGFAVPRQNLQRLILIRWLMLSGLLLGTAIGTTLFAIHLPVATIIGVAAVIAVLIGISQLRLRADWPLTEIEFATHILADIVGISCIFYFLGGASNPFISYYLVPVAIAAATLPWQYSATLTLISVFAYSCLLYFYQPIAMLEPGQGGHGVAHVIGFHPHTIGMWFNFLLSAGLISFFVVRMATALTEREQQLSLIREDGLRDEQVLAVATLAAGTAHEMGTPLTTMKVLVNELRAGNRNDPELASDLAVIDRQIVQCRDILKKLVTQSEMTSTTTAPRETVESYCLRIFDQWQLLRPDVEADIHIPAGRQDIEVSQHPTIDQAILNVLNNAADASPDSVIVDVNWDVRQLCITIDDTGPGIDQDIAGSLGQSVVSNKGRGLGLGIFLSNATINRFGGSLKFSHRDEGGTRTEIVLPIHSDLPAAAGTGASL
jgi:two-component system sensor histidine kinase RegB